MLISVYFPLNIAIAWIQHLVGWNPVQLLECHIPMRELWELVLNWNPYGLISGPYGAWERQILGNNYDHPSMGHGMEVRLGCQYIKWCVHFYWYHLSIACPQANRLGCCMNHFGHAKRLNYSWRTTTHQQDQGPNVDSRTWVTSRVLQKVEWEEGEITCKQLYVLSYTFQTIRGQKRAEVTQDQLLLCKVRGANTCWAATTGPKENVSKNRWVTSRR